MKTITTWEEAEAMMAEERAQLEKEKRTREAMRAQELDALRKCHCDYAVKERIVRSGNSKIFQSWHETTGVSMGAFLDGLKWLCDDPMTEGRLSRELGSIMKAPYLVKLDRRYGQEGLCAFYEHDTHRLWGGHVSLSARDRV